MQDSGIAGILIVNRLRQAVHGGDVFLVAALEIDSESDLLFAPEAKVYDRASIDMNDPLAAAQAQRRGAVFFEALDFMAAWLRACKGAEHPAPGGAQVDAKDMFEGKVRALGVARIVAGMRQAGAIARPDLRGGGGDSRGSAGRASRAH